MVYLDEDTFIQVELDPLGVGSRIVSYALKLGDEWLLVDAGPARTAKDLIAALSSSGVAPSKIFITHAHIDHSGGLETVLLEWPEAVVYAHPRAKPHLENPVKLWKQSREAIGWLANVFGAPGRVPSDKIIVPGDGEEIIEKVRAYYTPGHASHHMSLYVEDMGILFPGSSIGMYLHRGATRIYFPTLTIPLKLEAYMDSLEKQTKLEPEIVALPHVGVHPAQEFLSLARNEIEAWIKAARRGVEAGVKTPEEMLAFLVKELEQANRVWKYSLSYDPLLERLLPVVSAGLLEAVQ